MKCKIHKPFCEGCSLNYIKSKIFDRAIPIECEIASCNSTIDEESELFKSLDQKTKDMYMRLTKQLIEKRKPCRVANCEGFLN